MKELDLNILKQGLPGITPAMGTFFAEAAIVSLQKQGHEDGVVLTLIGDHEETFRLRWSPPASKEVLKNWGENKMTTENGALAIALLLAKQVADLDAFENAKIGSATDYWLLKAAEDDFIRVGLLEISGIAQETPFNRVQDRLKEKQNRLDVSDNANLPGLVIVVEFNSPKAKIARRHESK